MSEQRPITFQNEADFDRMVRAVRHVERQFSGLSFTPEELASVQGGMAVAVFQITSSQPTSYGYYHAVFQEITHPASINNGPISIATSSELQPAIYVYSLDEQTFEASEIGYGFVVGISDDGKNVVLSIGGGGGGGGGGSDGSGSGGAQTQVLRFLTDVCLNAITIPDFVGATDTVNGEAGLVPAPQAGDETKVLFGNGTWGDPSSGGSPELTAIAAVTGTGILRRTGPSTWVAGDPIVTSEIDDGAVTFAKMEDLAGLSVLARATNTAGVMAALTAGTDHFILKRSGTSLIWDLIQTANIADSAVTLAKQANFAASSLQGNPTGSPAVPSAITLGPGLEFSGTTIVASADNDESILGADFTGATLGTWTDVGISITTPHAGRFMIDYDAISFLYITAGVTPNSSFRLYNVTAGAILADSGATAAFGTTSYVYYIQQVSKILRRYFATAVTIKLQVLVSSGPTYAEKRVLTGARVGYTQIKNT